jgi:hypothetical protein
MRPMRFLILAAGTLMLAPRPIQAAVPGYTVQTIAKTGDKVADVQIAKDGYFQVGSLNGNGEISFIAQSGANGEMLLQYSSSDGKFAPIVGGGRDAPGGKWTRGGGIWAPVSMNQQGDMAFGTVSPGNTYVYSHQSGQASLVAAKGLPAINDLTFASSSDQTAPVINDVGEVVFQVRPKGVAERVKKLLARRLEDLIVQRPGDPEAGRCDQVVEHRPDRCKEATALCLNQDTQDTDTAQTQLAGHPARPPLVEQDQIGFDLVGESDRLGLPGIQSQAETRKQRGRGDRSLLEPWQRLHLESARQSRTDNDDLDVDSGWDEDRPVQLLEEIEATDSGQLDDRRGIADDDHIRPSERSVSRSASNSAPS